ncbi:MAG: response regulator [Halobacteriota archaeon]
MGVEKEIKILVVEDTEEHADIIKHVLTKGQLKTRVFIAKDGEEALEFLYNRDNPMPDLILLDLRLPLIDGLEVLEQIKSEEKTKDIPVIVLTASKRDDDIVEAYKKGAKSYILKSAFIVHERSKMDGLLDAIFSLL